MRRKSLIAIGTILLGIGTGVSFVFDFGGIRVTLSNRWYEVTHPEVVGGSCLCCEGALEYSHDEDLQHVGTLSDYAEADQNKIEISGVVYQSNGLTPAQGVILYIYHADQTGHFPQTGDLRGCAQVHGTLRGWLRTNAQGAYTFLTARPGSEGGMLAHIHLIVKEPDKNAYEVAAYTFADDPLFAGKEALPRGGSGVLSNGIVEEGMARYRRDILLGLNVPNYP